MVNLACEMVDSQLTRQKQIALIMDKWQRMTITSDAMFGMVMQNVAICLELINRALPGLKTRKIVQLDIRYGRLQEAQKEPEHDLKKLSAHDLNKSYQGLQQQVQQARNPQQKSELKNKLNDIHHEISNRTQKQLQAFTEENSSIKQPKSELDQSLKR